MEIAPDMDPENWTRFEKSKNSLTRTFGHEEKSDSPKLDTKAKKWYNRVREKGVSKSRRRKNAQRRS